jgi:hypothetical protein
MKLLNDRFTPSDGGATSWTVEATSGRNIRVYVWLRYVLTWIEVSVRAR